MKKYPIKKDKKFDAFQLSSQQDNYLFVFGNDLMITKQDINQSSINERNGYFDYGREKNALLGRVGSFDIQRILVIQLE